MNLQETRYAIERTGSTDYLTALNYLQSIAQQHGVDISSWDINEVLFPESKWADHSDFPLVRGVINRLFMRHVRKLEKAETKGLPAFSKEIELLITKHASEAMQHTKEGLHTVIAAQTKQINNMRINLESLLKSRGKFAALLHNSGDKPLDLKAKIQEVVDQVPWLKFYVYNRDSFDFITTVDLTLGEKDEQKGLDYQVNLGRFLLRFYPKSLSIAVLPYKDNVKVMKEDRYYFHPHVSASTALCFGDGLEKLHELQSTCDLVGIFQLAIQILNTYSPSNSPYVGLHELYNKKNNIVPQPAARMGNNLIIDPMYRYTPQEADRLQHHTGGRAHFERRFFEDRAGYYFILTNVADVLYAVQAEARLAPLNLNAAAGDLVARNPMWEPQLIQPMDRIDF